MPFKGFDELRGGARGADGKSDERPLVFILDDDAIMREALKIVLKRAYRVRTFADAISGITAIDGDTATVVLDVKMPGMDGLTACGVIREKHPDLPVIFHSAHQDIKSPDDVIAELRPFAYVVKTGDLGALLGTVAAATRKHAQTIERKKLRDSST